MDDISLPSAGTATCADCARLYSAGFDIIIPDAAWERISPRGNGGGLLCPNCMHDRLVAAGFDVGEAPGIIASGPMCSPADGTDYYFAVAKSALLQNETLRAAISALPQKLEEAREAVRQQMLTIVHSEPEAPGPIPATIAEYIQRSPEDCMRAAIRATKHNIANRMAHADLRLSRAPSLEPRHERQDELGGERPAEREPDAGEGPA